jgi:hypothetical protein
VEKMTFPLSPIAEEYSQSSSIAAIRGAQADTIRYPEFAKRSTTADVIAYWSLLTGKRVIYFGRKGVHIEEFPCTKS